MAGTKLIRFGRVEKMIDEVELHVKVLKSSLEIIPDTDHYHLFIKGQVMALEGILTDLYNLGK
jgi:hypothetical protein